MPLTTNALERLVLTSRFPALLFDYFSTLGFRTAIAAMRLGVFDALDKEPATSAELANRLGTDPRGTGALLEALTSLHYVKRRGDRYANAPTAQKWLTAERDPDFVEATRFLESAAFDLWADLEAAVRTGHPVRPIYDWLEADASRSAAFQAWARWITHTAAPELARRVPPPGGARRLIDLGGGHGRYAAAYCRAFPDLTAVVLDLPTALRSAEDLLEEPALKGRIHLQPANFLTDGLGEGFDIALMINIVHGLTEDENRELLRRVAHALKPGGFVVIVEQFAGRALGPAVYAFQTLIDLTYHLALGGRTYRFADASAWLTDAGFGTPRRINLRSAPATSVAVAVRG